MPDLSARKYDMHYRRLGLKPGATPAEIGASAESLKVKLSPERFKDGPLKDIAPFRLVEVDESASLLQDYWQRHEVAPPSIQARHLLTEAAPIGQIGTPESFSLTSSDESEITNNQVIGPQTSSLAFTYALFKMVDGQAPPHSDFIKARSIIGLLLLGALWVALPLLVARLVALLFPAPEYANWVAYITMICQVVPVCFVPPLVIYEYAMFRQLQFPFAGALRTSLDQAFDECISRLTVKSPGFSAGWTVEKSLLEKEQDAGRGEIVAVFSGDKKDAPLPLRIHIKLEQLGPDRTFMAYWFELDWFLLLKGRAVSRAKSARFELERLIKEH